jgi:hypothetical protein
MSNSYIDDLNDVIFSMNNTYIDTDQSDMINYINSANIDITIKNHLKELIYENSFVSYDMINSFLQ